MKIISWNVNGIRAVEKKGFADWLENCGADVVCIQETKANPSQLSPSLLRPEGGYHSYFSSAKKAGYSGTAIYSKTEPDKIETLGIAEFDDEGRTTAAYFGKTIIISAYFPNSQGQGLRLGYKLGYCNAMYEYCNQKTAEGFDVILCGDYNIAHTPDDIANPKSNEQNAGYLPEERAWMDFFTTHGYTDTFRMFCKEKGNYTWWSYRFHAREKNIGWRIDYLCVNDSFKDHVKSSTILKDITGSDHCPVEIEII